MGINPLPKIKKFNRQVENYFSAKLSPTKGDAKL
jgi:hypothetical protein